MRRWAAGLAIALVALAACSGDDDSGGGGGSSDTTVVAVDVDDFSAVVVAGSLDADITVGSAASASIHGTGDDASKVTAEVTNGNLFLRTPDGFQRSGPLDVVLTTPSLTQVSIAGTGNLTVTGVQADRFIAEIAGTGNLTASGAASSLTASLGGRGDLALTGLPADDVDVQLIGQGNVGVHANRHLKINIIGDGNVVYQGDPTVEQVITGNGTVQKAS